MTNGRFSIICLSPQDWRASLPTNRQQIMLRAARSGHEVLFVETGNFVGRHLSALLRGSERRSLAHRMLWTEQVVEGVRLRKALNVLPWGSKYWVPNVVNSRATARLLRIWSAGLPQPVVLWIYDASTARMVGRCGEEFAVYDCVDDYAAQATSARKRVFVAACERIVCRRSRLVFTTTKTLYDRHDQINPKTYLVPNAGDYEHFAPARDRSIAVPEAADLPRPVLGFAGNFLSSKVDFNLLQEIALRRPQWSLMLIGPAHADTAPLLHQIARLANVHWLGPKPYSELPRYVAAFDLGLIPYVSNAYTRSCFPLKLYEYLAAGKGVVASGLPELGGMEPDVLVADGTHGFLNAVEEALGRLGTADQNRRIRLASRNTWEIRTERLLGLIESELEDQTPAA